MTWVDVKLGQGGPGNEPWLVKTQGIHSALNNSTTPLNAAATFTGGAEQNDCEQVLVICKTDQNGILYIDLSPDGTNWDTSLPFSVDAGLSEIHRVLKASRHVRIRFENTSASNQTYLRLYTYYGQFGPITSALNATIREDADAQVIRSVDAEIDIAAGRFQGYEIVNKFGYNGDIDSGTLPEDVWGNGGVYTGFPTSDLETISVFSSSTDDSSTGTGARTVRLVGLNANYEQIAETVTLNGLTPVATIQQFRRAHSATTITAGAGGVNAGTITFRHTTTTANVFLSMQVGRNQTNASAYTVPAGYTAYMRHLHASVIFGTSTGVEGNVWTRAFGSVFRSRRPFFVTVASRLNDIIYGGLVFTEKSDIVIRITQTTDNNVAVNAGYDLLLVKNI